MTENDNNKVGLKFWIAALAFSVFLLAITFAAMAVFLADIKNNTLAAIARTDIVTERLNILDAEVMAIHHRLVEDKAASNGSVVITPPEAAAPTPAPVVEAPVPQVTPPAAAVTAPAPAAVAPLVKDVTPPAVSGSLPTIQAPVMTPPVVTPPATK